MKRITEKMIEKSCGRYRACEEGLRLFKEMYPHGVLPTPENIARIASLQRQGESDGYWLLWAVVDCKVFGNEAVNDLWSLYRDFDLSEGASLSYENPTAFAEAIISLSLALEDWEYDMESGWNLVP